MNGSLGSRQEASDRLELVSASLIASLRGSCTCRTPSSSSAHTGPYLGPRVRSTATPVSAQCCRDRIAWSARHHLPWSAVLLPGDGCLRATAAAQGDKQRDDACDQGEGGEHKDEGGTGL